VGDQQRKRKTLTQPKLSTVFYFIAQAIRPFYGYLLGMLGIAVLAAADLSLRPYLLKVILNRLTSLAPSDAYAQLWLPALCYVAVSAFIQLAFRGHEWLSLNFKPNLKRHMGQLLTYCFMHHSHSFYQQHLTGRLVNQFNDVMHKVPNLIRLIIDAFFRHCLALLIAIYTVWQVDYKFALGLSLWVVLFILSALWLSPRSKALSDNAANAWSSVVGYIADLISNMMNVRLFNGQAIESHYIQPVIHASNISDKQRDRFFLLIHSVQAGSFVLFQSICLWWLIEGIQNATLTPGDFALILTINISLVDALWVLAKDVRDFAENLGSVAQGLRVIYQPMKLMIAAPKHKDLVVSQGRIEFQSVKFHYKSAQPLFKDLSFGIEPGEKVGLVGFSGSGKTTLVNLMLRIFEITAGKIYIDGQDIQQVSLNSLRDAIAMIPQDPSLFHRSILDNIGYGHPQASEAAIIQAAKQAHAHEFIMRMPEQYQSLAGERGVKLSGGQRQRVAMARAFLKNAPILILDEATSQLDSAVEALIQDSLYQLMAHKTTLVIAHRLSTLLEMDRILVFDQGKLVEAGSHRELIVQGGLYQKLWNAQVKGVLPEKRKALAKLVTHEPA
jgi:ATP-binding cassette subfamily B protein